MGSDTEAEKSIQKEKKKVISLAPIAKPLAGKKLQKKTFKLIQKGTNQVCFITIQLCVLISLFNFSQLLERNV